MVLLWFLQKKATVITVAQCCVFLAFMSLLAYQITFWSDPRISSWPGL